MAEPTQLGFSYKEVVEALVRKQKISSGIWKLYIKFGIAAANIKPGAGDLSPAAIVPVLENWPSEGRRSGQPFSGCIRVAQKESRPTDCAKEIDVGDQRLIEEARVFSFGLLP